MNIIDELLGEEIINEHSEILAKQVMEHLSRLANLTLLEAQALKEYTESKFRENQLKQIIGRFLLARVTMSDKEPLAIILNVLTRDMSFARLESDLSENNFFSSVQQIEDMIESELT